MGLSGLSCGKFMRQKWRFYESSDTVCARSALQYHHSRPGSAATGVSRTWSSSKGPLAVGDGLAEVARSERLEDIHGARRREGSSGHRDGHTPGANADGAQTHRTRRVAGNHPSASDGRLDVGATRLS